MSKPLHCMESLHLMADIPQKALIEKEGKVLLTLDKKQMWEPPGGRLHGGEDPREGLRREIREELSVDVEPREIVHSFVFVSASGQAHYVVVFAASATSSLEEKRMDENELNGMRWVGADEFEHLPMRDGYKEALRMYFQKRAA